MTYHWNQSKTAPVDLWPIGCIRTLVVLEIYFQYEISSERVRVFIAPSSDLFHKIENRSPLGVLLYKTTKETYLNRHHYNERSNSPGITIAFNLIQTFQILSLYIIHYSNHFNDSVCVHLESMQCVDPN